MIAMRRLFCLGFALTSVAVQAQEHAPVTDEKVASVVKDQLRPYLDKLIADNQIPGMVVAIVHKDQVVYLSGGVRKVGEPAKVNEDTVFQLASMSKPVSSTIVALLVSKGLLTWQSKISDLDPAFEMNVPWVTNQLTLTDCFSHRSGFPGECGNELEEIGYDRDEILRRLRFVPPAYSFRAGYSYSNFMLTEGGIAAAKATGKSWEDVAEDELYKPLGMTSTSDRYSDFLSCDNRAALHIQVDNKWNAKLERMPNAQAPAGGVSSNAKDLVNWVKLQLDNGKFNGKQLISKDALDATHQIVVNRGNGYYGLGWNVEWMPDGRYRLGHAGAFSVGARTSVSLIPEDDLGIVVLSNCFPTGAPEAVIDVFYDNVYFGKPRKDWLTYWNGAFQSIVDGASQQAKSYAKAPEPVRAAAPNEMYVGDYSNDYVGKISVVERDKQLVLLMGPKRFAFPLRAYSGDVFLYYPTAEWPTVPSALTFSMGPDGKAASLTLGDWVSTGNSVVNRVTASS